MPEPTRRLGALARRALAVGMVAGLVVSAAAASATVAPHKKKKPLSMTSITINGGYSSGDFGPIWIAARGGFFKKEGITSVNLLNTSLSGAQSVALLLAGSSQFTVSGSAADIEADQAGGNLEEVVALDYGSTEETAINANFAAAHNVPTTAHDAAQVKAQLLALKGSHVNIAVSTVGSDAYAWLAALAKREGLTVGQTQGGSADINIVPTGSVPNAMAAVQSGKYDGISNTPPNTVITTPATITIPLHLLTSNVNWGALATDTPFIQQHRDVVQAAVNAIVEANQLSKAHPARAYKLYSDMMVAASITSPEEIQYLWQAQSSEWIDVLCTRGSYDRLLSILNGGGAVSVNVPYASFVASKFAINAYAHAGLKLPNVPSIR